MCTDSLGGVFVTWQDKRSGIDDDIYGTHVTAEHEIVSRVLEFQLLLKAVIKMQKP